MSERAPDIAGEIVGFRAWAVARPYRGGPVLVSLAHRVEWPQRAWMVAECWSCGDGVPGEPCYADGRSGHGCGINAARDRAQLGQLSYADDEFVEDLWPELGPVVVAVGEVGLAGKVVVGEEGWRAQRARPLRLWLPYVHWDLARPLGAAYGCPVGLANPLRLASA